MPTEYRKVGDGFKYWLEYKETIKIFWFKFSFWTRVESAHYDEWTHTGNGDSDYKRYVNSYNYSLENFVATYPNIVDWFRIRNETINRAKALIMEKQSKREQSYSGIKKLS